MSNKKTVVHIITSLKMGGAESLLVDFLTFSQDRAYANAVIYFHDGPHVQSIKDLGVPIYQVQGGMCLYDPHFFICLYRTLKALKPSLVHTWLWSANIAGRMMGMLLGVPVVNSFHNNVDQNGLLRGLLDKYSQRMATYLIAVSEGVANSLKQQYKIPVQRIKIIKNGIHAEVIIQRGQTLRKTRREIGLNEHHFVIGSVGRFVPLKNYPLLLDAFAVLAHKFDHIRLLLLGGGPEEHALRLLAKNHDILDKVHFVIGQQAYGFYPLFDCFVLSSYKEGMSLALLEAMSFGLPCISTYEGGSHAVIRNHKNGLLIPFFGKEQQNEAKNGVIEAIQSIIEDSTKAQLLGQNAYKTVKGELSLTNMLDSYEEIYLKSFKYSNKFIDKYNICN